MKAKNEMQNEPKPQDEIHTVEIPKLSISIVSEEKKQCSLWITDSTKQLLDEVCKSAKKTQDEALTVALQLYKQLIQKNK